MIAPAIPHRVERLLPLLGSDQPGEVTNACRAISRDLGAVGLDWHGVKIVPKTSPGSPPSASSSMPNFFDMARACRDLDDGRLSDRERRFVEQMRRLGSAGRPSVPQADWLAAIFVRLSRRAA